MMFELLPRPTNGEDGKPLLYARPAAPHKRTMKDVERYCSFRGVSSGQVIAALETVKETISEWLAEGYRVETPFGVFAPKIRLKGDFTDPKKVKGKDIKFTGIELTPSKRFVKEVASKQKGFYRKGNIVGCEQLHDEDFMAESLSKSLASGFTTIQAFMATTKLKYSTAKRYLDTLCSGDSPTLRKQKIGGAIHYFPVKQDT